MEKVEIAIRLLSTCYAVGICVMILRLQGQDTSEDSPLYRSFCCRFSGRETDTLRRFHHAAGGLHDGLHVSVVKPAIPFQDVTSRAPN